MENKKTYIKDYQKVLELGLGVYVSASPLLKRADVLNHLMQNMWQIFSGYGFKLL